MFDSTSSPDSTSESDERSIGTDSSEGEFVLSAPRIGTAVGVATAPTCFLPRPALLACHVGPALSLYNHESDGQVVHTCKKSCP